MELRQIALRIALWLSSIWDLLTTLLGTLLILGSQGFVQIGIALVGTVIVGALNFSTKTIWQPKRPRSDEDIVVILLTRFIWVLAILFDFLTSLTCNAAYVAYRGLNIGQTQLDYLDIARNLNEAQVLIVLFVTVFCSAGPMLLGYIKETDDTSNF